VLLAIVLTFVGIAAIKYGKRVVSYVFKKKPLQEPIAALQENEVFAERVNEQQGPDTNNESVTKKLCSTSIPLMKTSLHLTKGE
jgi:hypothetical protein